VPGVFVGRSEAELVSALGVPTRVYDQDGRRVLSYDGAGAAQPAVVPSIGLGFGRSSFGWGSATGVGIGTGLTFGSFGGSQPCTTSYEIRDGLVLGATRSGPGCG